MRVVRTTVDTIKRLFAIGVIATAYAAEDVDVGAVAGIVAGAAYAAYFIWRVWP